MGELSAFLLNDGSFSFFNSVLFLSPPPPRGFGSFRNSIQAFAQGVKIPRPFAFLAVRHMAICGKMVDYISGHKQFDVSSAISNFKKILIKNISPFGTVQTESENIWIC